jgi:ABC-type Fe3+-citrate transport system substrate-binding protein
MHHEVELSFIDSLHAYGLITVTVINEEKYLLPEELKEIEKFVQFYYDLGINIEGIEVITDLLIQNASLQHELESALKKLHIFEADFIQD